MSCIERVLPAEILAMIADFACEHYWETAVLSLVSRRMRAAAFITAAANLACDRVLVASARHFKRSKVRDRLRKCRLVLEFTISRGKSRLVLDMCRNRVELVCDGVNPRTAHRLWTVDPKQAVTLLDAKINVLIDGWISQVILYNEAAYRLIQPICYVNYAAPQCVCF